MNAGRISSVDETGYAVENGSRDRLERHEKIASSVEVFA